MILLPTRRARVSQALLDFRAADCVDESGLFARSYGSRVAANLSRPSRKRLVDQNGRVFVSPVGTPSLGRAAGLTTLLLEPSATPLALHNRDLTDAVWTKSNVTAARTQVGADGAANSATLLTATAANGTVLQSITSASAVRVTAVRARRVIGVGVIEMTQDNGATWTPLPLSATFTRFELAAATLADPIIGFRIVASGDAIAVDFIHHEVAPVATSDVFTAGSTSARARDVCYFELAGLNAPRALSVYLRGVNRFGRPDAYSQNSFLWGIGVTAAISANDTLYSTSRVDNRLRCTFDNASVEVVSQTPVSTVFSAGDVLEQRTVLSATGEITQGIAMNGGVESLGATSGANGFPPVWNSIRATLARDSNDLPFAVANFVIAEGVRSLEQLRELAGV